MTLRAYCDRNNVSYKVMENFMNAIRTRIVLVEVMARPGVESTPGKQESEPPTPSPRQSGQPKSNPGYIEADTTVVGIPGRPLNSKEIHH